VKQRCKWVGTDLLYVEYHNNEWGIPLHDDRKLFELLILEGMPGKFMKRFQQRQKRQ
jgi:DNA-3-methyladenine glycosylase I